MKNIDYANNKTMLSGANMMIAKNIFSAEQLAVDARQITKLLPFSLATVRRMDKNAMLPKGFKVKGRKVWRVSDLRKWCELGFPSRKEFEIRTEK